jgi:hypothetical protein
MLDQAAVGPESHSRSDGNMWREAGLERGTGGAATRINCNPAISEFPKFRLTVWPNQYYSNPVPPPLEGRFAIVTDVGGGMRWTRRRF